MPLLKKKKREKTTKQNKLCWCFVNNFLVSWFFFLFAKLFSEISNYGNKGYLKCLFQNYLTWRWLIGFCLKGGSLIRMGTVCFFLMRDSNTVYILVCNTYLCTQTCLQVMRNYCLWEFWLQWSGVIYPSTLTLMMLIIIYYGKYLLNYTCCIMQTLHQ